MSLSHSDAYQRIEGLISADQCVILDGGGSTELQRVGLKDFRLSDESAWGTWALYNAPYAALEVHRRFVTAGCDLISTHTWAIADTAALDASGHFSMSGAPSHWMDIARLGVRLARQAISEAGKTGETAVAFSLHGGVDNSHRLDTLKLLARVFEEDPPDLILLETLSLIPEDLRFPAIEIMLETGLPVWLSYRRCRHGVCGVYGQHWGGPEGDLFGRAARVFANMGIGALLINCLPVGHVPGILSWLRDFTDMPLGVYPNLGHYLDPGWRFDDKIDPPAYADLALEWRAEGAQIIGGCCGVTPDHIAAAATRLANTKPGRRKPKSLPDAWALIDQAPPSSVTAVLKPWSDEKDRTLYPLPFPEVSCDPGVFRPTQGSFLVWKHLFREGVGRDLRCLDVGSGAGILTVQLALNGAKHVDALDIQSEAVANTLANAFRNGVADRVRGRTLDLYAFFPEETYDVIVASLYQMPVDPMGEIVGHRPVDFWGRNLLDHLITLLPDLLAPGGVAYLMQISILGQLRTMQLLQEHGLESEVVDFAFFNFSPVFYENIDQIRRVERLSDAYHLTFADDDIMVMYLLKVTRKDS